MYMYAVQSSQESACMVKGKVSTLLYMHVIPQFPRNQRYILLVYGALFTVLHMRTSDTTRVRTWSLTTHGTEHSRTLLYVYISTSHLYCQSVGICTVCTL